MKLINLIMSFLLFWGCASQKEQVMKSQWKYQEGYHIGDVIHFDSTNYFTIDDNGKIYKQGDCIATVKKVSNKKLQVISNKNEVGFYVFLDESK